MSIVGILGSNLFSGAANGLLGSQGAEPRFEQIKQQFQQLGQDLQSGNIAQAQTDYATLSSEFSGGKAAGAAAASTGTTASASGTSTAGTTAATGTTSLAQQFAQLGQDLQSGNLQAAQQDYTNLQQTAQQNGAQQVGGYHHRGHHHHGGFESASSSSSSSSQQSNPIAQAFSTLAQDLQAGNLSGAQSAFATLQSDLQQIGGFASSGSSSTSPTSTGTGAATGVNLNVSA